MDLKNLVLRGFATARLTAGGDEQAQDPRWLGQKAQAVLLDRLRTLAIQCEAIDADEDLSEAGKARKRAELGTVAMKEIESDLATVRTALTTKLATAKARLAEAAHPEASDFDRLARLLRIQNQQRLLLELDNQSLLGELIRASREGDDVTFAAISELPGFLLRERGIAKETVAAARKQMMSRLDPLAVAAVEDSQTMSRLVDENISEAQRAIREFCGVPEERSVRVYK